MGNGHLLLLPDINTILHYASTILRIPISPMIFSDTITNYNRYQAAKTLLKNSIAVPTPSNEIQT